jgi:hypothetical protein
MPSSIEAFRIPALTSKSKNFPGRIADIRIRNSSIASFGLETPTMRPAIAV